VELESPDPGEDPDGFRARVRAAFLSCTRAVEEELARHRPRPEADGAVDACHIEENPDGPHRPATGSQVRALRALCRRQGVDLDALVTARSGGDGPEGLSAAEAGRLIDELQQAPADPPA